MGNNHSNAAPKAAPPAAPAAIVSTVPELSFYHLSDKGTVLEVYTVDQELGSGGFGKVYKVHDRDGNPFALKMIRCKATDIATYRKEVAVLQGLDHRNITKYKTSFELKDGTGAAICIVMELVEGADLKSVLEGSSPLPLQVIMGIFIEILEVLAYLHSKPIAHCDLKPANVMIGKDNVVKLVDFGLALQLQSSMDTVNQVGGTLPYMAPEVLLAAAGKPNGFKRLVSKIDIWPLGLILYEALTSDRSWYSKPLGFTSYLEEDNKIIAKKVDDYSLALLLGKMLEINPEKRASAQELLDSDLISGWRMALDPKHKAREKPPQTVWFVSPSVSLLTNNCHPSLVGAAISYLSKWATEIQDVRLALLQIGAVPRICRLAMSDRMDRIPAEMRRKLELANSQMSQARPQVASSSGTRATGAASLGTGQGESEFSLLDMMIMMLTPQPTRDKAFDLLAKLLNLGPYHHQTAAQVYACDAVPFLLEEFKHAPDTMAMLLALLCRCRSTWVELKDEGIEYVTVGMLTSNSHFTRSAMTVYEEFRAHEDQRGLTAYLEQLLQRKPAFACQRLGDLLFARDDSHTIIDAGTLPLWQRVLAHCHSSAERDERWFCALMQAILPMRQLVRGQTLRQECTLNVTGATPCEQLLAVCAACTRTYSRTIHVCVSCSRRCHEGHPLAGPFTPMRGYCYCSRTGSCQARVASSSPMTSISTNKDLQASSHQYFSLPRVCVWPAHGRFRIKPHDSGAETRFYLFQDRGIVVHSSPSESAVFYYEARISRSPKCAHSITCGMSFGLACSFGARDIQSADHMLGWQRGEWGYHADDGKVFSNQSRGANYGPMYNNGDVIGCGITNNRRVFYTINGHYLGLAPWQPIEEGLTVFASFSCYGSGMDVELSYSGPFMYEPVNQREIRYNLNAVRALFPEPLSTPSPSPPSPLPSSSSSSSSSASSSSPSSSSVSGGGDRPFDVVCRCMLKELEQNRSGDSIRWILVALKYLDPKLYDTVRKAYPGLQAAFERHSHNIFANAEELFSNPDLLSPEPAPPAPTVAALGAFASAPAIHHPAVAGLAPSTSTTGFQHSTDAFGAHLRQPPLPANSAFAQPSNPLLPVHSNPMLVHPSNPALHTNPGFAAPHILGMPSSFAPNDSVPWLYPGAPLSTTSTASLSLYISLTAGPGFSGTFDEELHEVVLEAGQRTLSELEHAIRTEFALPPSAVLRIAKLTPAGKVRITNDKSVAGTKPETQLVVSVEG